MAASAPLLVVCLLFLRSLLFIGAVDPGFDIDHGMAAKVAPEERVFTTEQSYVVAEEPAKRRAHGDRGPSRTRVPGRRPQRCRGCRGGQRDVREAVLPKRGCHRQAGAPSARRRCRAVERDRGRGGRQQVRVLFRSTDATALSPFLQRGGRVFLQIRTASGPSASISAVRRMIAEYDQSLLADVRTTRDATSLEFVLRRISTTLLAAMGILGLVLSTAGWCGVLSREVTRRTRKSGSAWRSAHRPAGCGA